jgi:small ligand-binding sensory domain FIST
MSALAIGSTQALSPEAAGEALANQVEKGLGGAAAVGGGLLLATSAAGSQGLEVGRILGRRWPRGDLVGTSFEGIVSEGRLWRDRPALALLAWGRAWGEEGARPGVFGVDAGEEDVPGLLAHEILEAGGRSVLGPEDLVLLFPDVHSPRAIEPLLSRLTPLLGAASIAGAGASGLNGDAAPAWLDSTSWAGSWVGLVLPGPEAVRPGDEQEGRTPRSLRPPRPRPRVRTAPASRACSPWMGVTRRRGHWIERLDGEPALARLRRELGLATRSSLEQPLDRLLVRIRAVGAVEGSDAKGVSERTDPEVYEERFVIGIDERRGAIALPTAVRSGEQIAFALPDPGLARDALRAGIEAIEPTDCLLHFGCRARDASLHGDPDLEPALVAHLARGRGTLGTVGPLQLGPDRVGTVRLLVHATVLAALGVARCPP